MSKWSSFRTGTKTRRPSDLSARAGFPSRPSPLKTGLSVRLFHLAIELAGSGAKAVR